MYAIIGKYKDNEPEQIDTFETRSEARAMLAEYVLAFGAGWTLWVEPVEDGNE